MLQKWNRFQLLQHCAKWRGATISHIVPSGCPISNPNTTIYFSVDFCPQRATGIYSFCLYGPVIFVILVIACVASVPVRGKCERRFWLRGNGAPSPSSPHPSPSFSIFALAPISARPESSLALRSHGNAC